MAPSKRRAVKRIRKKKSPRGIIIGVAALIVITVGGVAALILSKEAQLSQQQESDTTLLTEGETKVGKEKTLEEQLAEIKSTSPLEQIILRHFAATKIDQVTTLKLHAQLQMGADGDPEKQHEIVFYFRQPNLARRVMIHDGLRLEMGYDGQEIWAQQIGLNGATRQVDELSEDMRSQFKEAARLGSCLWKYQETPERFSLLNDAPFDGKICHVIAYEDEHERVLTYLDPDTYWEVANERHYHDNSRPAAIMRMSNHRADDGVVMPTKIVTSSEGKTYSVATIDEMEVNASVPSYIFQNPSIRYSAK
ncbi:hypothetical protein [Cerasicoccus maritimus]|uniref:hypothetical protein n=1 Tax=Cerasicoccus maritimus TaxID=490089 RepID=UPI002852CF4C|nr:hypothetical protein [Cerasicoccus maritimus]